MSRTINIQITNYSGVTLTFQNAQSQEGPPAKANMPSVANKQTMTVTAYNNSTFNGGNKGTFVLSNNAGISYTIFYTHPQLSGATYVQLQSASESYIAGIGEPTYTGDPVTATMNLYSGVPVQSDTPAYGYAVPLSYTPYSQPNNCQDFANSMYGPNMRASGLVTSAYSQSTTPFYPATSPAASSSIRW